MEKKHFYLLVGVLSILGIFTVFAATSFNSNLGYHPLQQVTVDGAGSASVDADFNSIIDSADNANLFGGVYTASSFCKSDGTDCPDLGAVNPDDFCKSDGTDCSNADQVDNSDTLGNSPLSSFCRKDGTNCPDLGIEKSILKFGGFYSKTGSVCNVLNPATAACLCPDGYADLTLDSPIHMCWVSEGALPPTPLVWGAGVFQETICSVTPFPPPNANDEGEDLEGDSCSSEGETNRYATSGQMCGAEKSLWDRYIQTCGYN
jgi:hypothetical protein